MNISTAYDEFIITQKLRGNSDKTLKYYHYCLSPFVTYIGENTDLQSLTCSLVKRYMISLSERDICSNSVKTYTKGVKCFLNWLYHEEYTCINLSACICLPKAQRKTIDVLTAIEIKSLFNSFDTKTVLGLRNYCICALMLDSGLRKSEIVSLQLSDLHILEGYILVNGKGNKQRIVPIGYDTQKHLIKYTSRRLSNLPYVSLFLTKDNTPITGSVISRLFKSIQAQKFCDDLFTSRIHAHLLRHTFATSYLENGGNIYSLQQILGHTSLDMVKKYVHLTTAKTVVNFKNYSPLDNLKKH